VVAPETAEAWISNLLGLRELTRDTARTMVQLARFTDDRRRDISAELREQAMQRLKKDQLADEATLRVLIELVAPSRSDVSLTFGEPLPRDLQLDSTFDCLSPVSAITAEKQ
jgi:hypothetical protein